jgi:acetyltransferase-like isoleucine patch superfamily enzyme
MKIFKYLKLLIKLLREEERKEKIIKRVSEKWPHAQIAKEIKIKGNFNAIDLGYNVLIGKNCVLNAGGKSYGKDGEIKIGNNTIIGSGSTVFAGGGTLIIGKNCELGLNSMVLAHTFIGEKNGEREFEYYSIEIGDGTFISSGAVIFGNTKIGNNCVIAAGAVVQGEFGDNLLIIGNPARALPKKK